MGLRVAENGGSYIFLAFALAYGKFLGIPNDLMLGGVLASMFVELGTLVWFGHLSDRIGRRAVYLIGAAGLMLVAFPFFWLVQTREPVWIFLAFFLGNTLCHAAMIGTQPAYFAELFRPRCATPAWRWAMNWPRCSPAACRPDRHGAAAQHESATPVAWFLVGMAAITVVTLLLTREPEGKRSARERRRDQTRSRIQTRHRRRRRDADAAPSRAWLQHGRPAGLAIGLLLADGVAPGEVDGLGVASFSLRPDRAIDLGWRLGLKLNWCMQDEMAAPAPSTCRGRPWLALEAGQARTIAGGRRSFRRRGFSGPGQRLQPQRARVPESAGLRGAEPAVRHADAAPDDVDHACGAKTTARVWRSGNGRPGTECRLSPALSLATVPVRAPSAPPLGRLDCVPVVSGACALVSRGPRACM